MTYTQAVTALPAGTIVTVRTQYGNRWEKLAAVALTVDSNGETYALTEEGEFRVGGDRNQWLTAAPRTVPAPAGAAIPIAFLADGALYVDWLPVVAIEIADGIGAYGDAVAIHPAEGEFVRSPSPVLPGTPEVYRLVAIRQAVGHAMVRAQDGDVATLRAAIRVLDERIGALSRTEQPVITAHELAQETTAGEPR